MASKELKNIFLSASVPLPDRKPKYFETADIIAIRDAVVSLASVALTSHRLVWGGHPSITPIINHVIQKLGLNIQDHMTIFQTKFYQHIFPEDNNQFDNVIQTEDTGEKDSSLLIMRNAMFSYCEFEAAIFIGGMDGVEDEFELFREFHPRTKLFPIASTGAASKIIYDKFRFDDKRLLEDYAYSSFFKDYLNIENNG
jgi:hypothetical protein